MVRNYREERDRCGPCDSIVVMYVAIAMMIIGVVGCMFLMAMLVNRNNAEVIPTETVLDRVTHIIAQYNQGLAQSKQTPPMTDAVLLWTACFVFVITCIMRHAWTERPRVIDTLAFGLLITIVVMGVIVTDHDNKCSVHDIVSQPYKTGVACGIKGYKPISLQALHDNRVAPNGTVTKGNLTMEHERIIERLVALTIQEGLSCV